MIPLQIIQEAKQFKEDCQAYINDPFWVRGAAPSFLDVARRDSQARIEDIAENKWAYLQYRANAKSNIWGNEAYIDKPARQKYLRILELNREVI